MLKVLNGSIILTIIFSAYPIYPMFVFTKPVAVCEVELVLQFRERACIRDVRNTPLRVLSVNTLKHIVSFLPSKARAKKGVCALTTSEISALCDECINRRASLFERLYKKTLQADELSPEKYLIRLLVAYNDGGVLASLAYTDAVLLYPHGYIASGKIAHIMFMYAAEDRYRKPLLRRALAEIAQEGIKKTAALIYVPQKTAGAVEDCSTVVPLYGELGFRWWGERAGIWLQPRFYHAPRGNNTRILWKNLQKDNKWQPVYGYISEDGPTGDSDYHAQVRHMSGDTFPEEPPIDE